MTKAKADLIAFGQTEDETTLREIVERWPSDLITGMELTNLLQDGGPSRPATRHAMDRVGIRKLGMKVRTYCQGSQRIYVVRNFDEWASKNYETIKEAVGNRSEDTLRNTFDEGPFTAPEAA